MKRILSILFAFFCTLTYCIAAPSAKQFTVVIDAGHGGKDPGALGTKINEKTLNLAVALELGKLIETKSPDVNVVYTRKTDIFLPLQDRADIVNKNKADLFICIHTNSAEAKSVAGAEVFTLGLHKAESNLDVAMRENAVMLLEDGYQTRYQGFNPNSVESYIMFEFMQDQYLDKSVNYASKAQNELNTTAGRIDRGVRQAGFWVLHKSSCPSVLVEMGFITNANEQTFLASAEGQKKIALALYNAFVDYKQEIDKKSGKPQAAASSVTEQETKQSESEQPAAKQPATEQNKKEVDEQKAETPAANRNLPTETKKTSQINPDSIVSMHITPETEKKKAETKDNKKPAVDANKPIYKVQCFAVRSVVKPDDPTLKGMKTLSYYKEDGWYKYTAGCTNSYTEIVALQQELKDKFPGCFIIAFDKGEKVKVKVKVAVGN